jgi:hypothetical protein
MRGRSPASGGLDRPGRCSRFGKRDVGGATTLGRLLPDMRRRTRRDRGLVRGPGRAPPAPDAVGPDVRCMRGLEDVVVGSVASSPEESGDRAPLLRRSGPPDRVGRVGQHPTGTPPARRRPRTRPQTFTSRCSAPAAADPSWTTPREGPPDPRRRHGSATPAAHPATSRTRPSSGSLAAHSNILKRPLGRVRGWSVDVVPWLQCRASSWKNGRTRSEIPTGDLMSAVFLPSGRQGPSAADSYETISISCGGGSALENPMVAVAGDDP